ncbi:uncharacterized protein PHALS_00859 [Plasmopara halstedii]|uniref:Uncharacterized protein n=1 Tax=Plasmopara halstedii TaxID=4781 RepID=A0A0N7L6K1_PLAHL|nr:uncharacterized protein PHALS_00859 [Plasmopara halstedii]CEG44499.1 hypothetical protein PHALS_00859 [Plasmopara halstedii]|eukprot:XP_024580868.1 hypothetical protein PHALS_00859 [Plasmopara halstedii]
MTDAERLPALPTAPTTTPSQHLMRMTSPSDMDLTKIQPVSNPPGAIVATQQLCDNNRLKLCDVAVTNDPNSNDNDTKGVPGRASDKGGDDSEPGS